MFLRSSLSLCAVTNCQLRAVICIIDRDNALRNMQQNRHIASFRVIATCSESRSGCGMASFTHVREFKIICFSLCSIP